MGQTRHAWNLLTLSNTILDRFIHGLLFHSHRRMKMDCSGISDNDNILAQVFSFGYITGTASQEAHRFVLT